MFGNKNQGRLNGANERGANVHHSRGRLEALGGYLYERDRLCSFAVSGTGPRELVVEKLLDAAVGNVPVLILHNNNPALQQVAANAWISKFEAMETDRGVLWLCDQGDFEPFLGMGEMDTVRALRAMASRLEYQCLPRFDRVVRAHMRILELLECPVSLSGFYYLCQFHDFEELHGNIMQLPCTPGEAAGIWADLGVERNDEDGQLDLFRNLVAQLGHEAKSSGWTADTNVGSMNCITALSHNATLSLWISNSGQSLLLDYLYQELEACAQSEFLLLIDGVQLGASRIPALLSGVNAGFAFGLISENLVEQLGGRENTLQFAAKLERFVFLKHSVASTAGVLAELMGKEDMQRASQNKGTGRGFWNILPQNAMSGVTITTENRFRVMPEAITGLGDGAAIVFDTVTDEIIFYH